MLDYHPRFVLATTRPPQERLRSKLGGLPWGLPQRHWPACCRQPMMLLAQLAHEPPMLDLGGDFVLHAWQCSRCLNIRKPRPEDALVLPGGELGEGLTPIPDTASEPVEMVGELWIDGWSSFEDGIDPAFGADYYESSTYRALPEDWRRSRRFEGAGDTKAGGVPLWTGNGVHNPAPPAWRLVMQIDEGLHLPGTPPSPDEAGCDVLVSKYDGRYRQRYATSRPKPNAPDWLSHRLGEDGYSCEVANFGSDGAAYILIDRRADPPQATWFWNR